jgi:ADP-dependent NAD(P)H-hydrate dehydratase / NAD(P)H-hydrate epimerase
MPSRTSPRTYWTSAEARGCIKPPLQSDHKYTRGVLGMVTGSHQYPGAAVLTTAAALATGVGMVRFFPEATRAELALLVLQRSPEVVVAPGKVHAWLLGSGIAPAGGWTLSNWLRHRQMATAKAHAAPTVLDAGSLYLAGTLGSSTLVTPHAGELAELLSTRGVPVNHRDITDDPQHWATMAQQTLGVTVLLKGEHTVVAGKDTCIALPPSTPWLATAGTGDVLAGIVGALVATQHLEVVCNPALMAPLAATAAYIHARAAELASGGGPLTASALIQAISQVMRELLSTRG